MSADNRFPFTQRLVAIRRHLGDISQRGISRKLGISPNTWSGYESRNTLPNSHVLEGLGSLGINVNWVLTGQGHIEVADELVAGPGLDLFAAWNEISPIKNTLSETLRLTAFVREMGRYYHGGCI